MLAGQDDNARNRPVTFQDAFADELKRIAESRAMRNPDAKKPPSESLIGLAFSGGGIRSACFNLGVLQALAESRLLHKFDYLSTVSGGGYIGSWLAALTRRLCDTLSAPGFAAVEQALLPAKYEPGKRNEPTCLHWLRMYSNYLTPHKGLVSGDTWALIGAWSRNVFLNQVILGLMFLCLFVVCDAVLLFLVNNQDSARIFLCIGGGILFLAASSMAWNVMDQTTFAGGQHWFGRVRVTVTVMVPYVIACVLVNCGLWRWLDPERSILWWVAGGAGFYFAAWGTASLLAAVLRSREAKDNRGAPRTVSLWPFLIFSSIAGAAGACVLREYSLLLRHLKGWPSESWIVVIFGSGAVMGALLVTGALHQGLVGLGSRDLVREWWARLGGYLILIPMGWLLLAGTCALGPLLVRWAIFRWGWGSVSAAVLWIAHNCLGAKAAYSSTTRDDKRGASNAAAQSGPTTEAGSKAKATEFLKSPRVLRAIAKLAPYVFAAGLILLLATAAHIGIGWVFDPSHTKELWWSTRGCGPKTANWYHLYGMYWAIQRKGSYLHLFIAGILLLGAGLALSWRVDVNEFSLHHFYRNRLVRCYLGASNPCRKPQAFTGFDPCDDIPLEQLAANYPGPYPILNATLNITSGEELGYATRRAKSFVFTPRYCGYEPRFAGEGEGRFTRQDGYIPTFSLAAEGRSQQPRFGTTPEGGIGLGTAMAISGAAASPNMGYFGTPATAFFMTLFDVRLGWWMGNPRDPDTWQSVGPKLGVRYLLAELLGQSDQNRNYLYLSDGGHFENLGVYELIKRHCKVIVACDVGCDPAYQFQDLIALIEKARTDFGARIELDFTRIRPKTGRESDYNFVVGTIYYDPQNAKDFGKFIYIKASMPKRERKEPQLPDDVWHYSNLHPRFPHETTADQWFDELQFESYRALGEFIAKEAVTDIRKSTSEFL